jgi:PD-(D/E)XK endonuclease
MMGASFGLRLLYFWGAQSSWAKARTAGADEKSPGRGVPSRPQLEKDFRRGARERGHLINHRGVLGEAAFVHRAVELGFEVAQPYGHSHRYDVIIDNGEKLWRVQVKACKAVNNGLYYANCCRRLGGRVVTYKTTELDFLAAYILPENAWFILPVKEIVGRASLLLRPKKYAREDPYGHYREAWELLREGDGIVIA